MKKSEGRGGSSRPASSTGVPSRPSTAAPDLPPNSTKNASRGRGGASPSVSNRNPPSAASSSTVAHDDDSSEDLGLTFSFQILDSDLETYHESDQRTEIASEASSSSTAAASSSSTAAASSKPARKKVLPRYQNFGRRNHPDSDAFFSLVIEHKINVHLSDFKAMVKENEYLHYLITFNRVYDCLKDHALSHWVQVRTLHLVKKLRKVFEATMAAIDKINPNGTSDEVIEQIGEVFFVLIKQAGDKLKQAVEGYTLIHRLLTRELTEMLNVAPSLSGQPSSKSPKKNATLKRKSGVEELERTKMYQEGGKKLSSGFGTSPSELKDLSDNLFGVLRFPTAIFHLFREWCQKLMQIASSLEKGNQSLGEMHATLMSRFKLYVETIDSRIEEGDNWRAAEDLQLLYGYRKHISERGIVHPIWVSNHGTCIEMVKGKLEKPCEANWFIFPDCVVSVSNPEGKKPEVAEYPLGLGEKLYTLVQCGAACLMLLNSKTGEPAAWFHLKSSNEGRKISDVIRARGDHNAMTFKIVAG